MNKLDLLPQRSTPFLPAGESGVAVSAVSGCRDGPAAKGDSHAAPGFPRGRRAADPARTTGNGAAGGDDAPPACAEISGRLSRARASYRWCQPPKGGVGRLQGRGVVMAGPGVLGSWGPGREGQGPYKPPRRIPADDYRPASEHQEQPPPEGASSVARRLNGADLRVLVQTVQPHLQFSLLQGRFGKDADVPKVLGDRSAAGSLLLRHQRFAEGRRGGRRGGRRCRF